MGGGDTQTAGAAGSIVRAAIHPAIGIARIGNSAEAFFIGPEVPDPPAQPASFYRDAQGALKRQAARFRIYGLDAEGRAVAELTPDTAEITWRVHLANRKGAWYQFQIALDIPEAAKAPPSMLRNITVADRTRLVIDPGPRCLHGRDQAARFDTGSFLGHPVALGEIRTDAQGRLLVLGGHGVSASVTGARVNDFDNNDGWYDDTADGPVTAEVRYNGVTLPVDPAWVVVAPPNYAPQQKSITTLWDLLRDVFIHAHQLPMPARPVFSRDILPIFTRMSALQWVNRGFATVFGWDGPYNFADPGWQRRMASKAPRDDELRRTLFNQFRTADRDGGSPLPWPWLYGDAVSISPRTERTFGSLTHTQMIQLEQWMKGDFDADEPGPPPACLDDVPLAGQPETLDRAALEFCLADAFHPGCEVTWPIRHAELFMAPFRILHAPPGWVEPSFGAALTWPYTNEHGQIPGGLTRWMAVPWQSDTASCRSGYNSRYDPNIPTFWPARVPNHVLTEADYQVVVDPARETEERLAAFARRADWTAQLGPDYAEALNAMVTRFGELGIVAPRPGPGDRFPERMQVADRPQPDSAG